MSRPLRDQDEHAVPLKLSPWLAERSSKAIEQVLKELGADLNSGLTSADAASRREVYGTNVVTPPHGLPAWLCCILPCLLKTPMMSLFNEIAGDQEPVQVLRNGRWIRMDAGSLVPGDIVAVSEGQRFPADVRIVRCAQQGVRCDVTDIIGSSEELVLSGTADKASNGSASEARGGSVLGGDMTVDDAKFVPMGALCDQGECRAVVVDTADETLLAEMISCRSWPPPGATNRVARSRV